MEPELAGGSRASLPTEPQQARCSKRNRVWSIWDTPAEPRGCGTGLSVIIRKSTLIIYGRDVINLKASLLLRGNKEEALGSQVRPREVYLLFENLQMASGK